ncbi:MAG: response regulator [Hyphomicrobiales bacterium]|nr:response regulator [Hyphomicrobiales bacterium]
MLHEAGVPSAICADVTEFEQALSEDVRFAVVTEEAFRSVDLRGVAARVAAQPAWSDIPFVVLTQRGGGLERNPNASRLFELLGNVTFLERPFHPTTFVSLARTASKGRMRQYEARSRILELHESEERLKRLNETLEERVARRTAELERAHAAVLAQIEQREVAERKLRHGQKMEMIGQLTGGVAHDFNNLLMAVIGNLDLLRKHLPRDAKTSRLIDGAVQGAQRGAALTQRLLAFARKQDLRVEPKNIVDLVRGMTDLIERSAGGQIELKINLPDSVPLVLVDASQIELALLNLVVNARDAMPEGGVLTIDVDERRAPLGGDLAPGRYVRLSVSDTGFGMDPETLKRATEPFFSTKELGKGTGLGLSMIQGLAAQLNGALQLTSELGRGSRAELWLPATTLAVQPAALPQIARPAANQASAPKITVLVVDDDALIAMSTVEMLEDLGHSVIEANSASRALEILQNGRVVDLLITDYSMPKMNGAQLASAARELRPALPILLATGYAELPSNSGVDLPRIAKPYRQDQLAATIAKVLTYSVPS